MIGADTLSPAVKAPRANTGGGFNPSGRKMRAHEKEATRRIAAALDKWRRDITRGMTADNIYFIVPRMMHRQILQPFTDAIIDVLRDITLDGAEHGQKQVERFIFGIKKTGIDIDWELANTDAEQWARQYGYNLVSGLTNTTRDRLQREISEWVTNQETINQLAKRLARPNGPFGEKRAKTIAVTETTRAFAEGNRTAWRQSGVVEQRRWNTNVDELVCPICGPLHNVVVGLEEAFPGGYDNAPAHPNCRCWITPVVEGAEEREAGLEQYGLVQQGRGHVDAELTTTMAVATTLDEAQNQVVQQSDVINTIMDANPPDQITRGQMTQEEWRNHYMSEEKDGYTLINVHPRAMNLPMEAGQKEKVNQFARRSPDNVPPIVVDSNEKIQARYGGGVLDRAFGAQPHTVIDGKHRVEAALFRGDDSMLAYVPKRKLTKVWEDSYRAELYDFALGYFDRKGYPVMSYSGDSFTVIRNGKEKTYTAYGLQKIGRNTGHVFRWVK